MALTSTTVETVEEAPKNGGRLCPQGEPSCLSHPHDSEDSCQDFFFFSEFA